MNHIHHWPYNSQTGPNWISSGVTSKLDYIINSITYRIFSSSYPFSLETALRTEINTVKSISYIQIQLWKITPIYKYIGQAKDADLYLNFIRQALGGQQP